MVYNYYIIKNQGDNIMEETYSLYYDDRCIAEGYTEEEFTKLLEELQLDYGWEPNGEYHYFYNNHYWAEKELPF